MRWIVDEDDAQAGFAQALRDAGTPFNVVSVLPFVGELQGRVGNVEPGEKVFVRGPFGLPEACAKRGWEPVIWTGPELSEESVQKALGPAYLNADGWTATLRDLTPDALNAAFTGEEKIFIKPAADTKTFSGQLVAIADIEGWAERMIKSGYVSPKVMDETVFVSRPQALGCEWRAFVVGGEIVTASCYRQYGRIMPEVWLPEPLMDFLRACVATYDPLPGYALDATQISDGTFRVLEMNTLNHAGIYAGDAGAIVNAVQRVLDAEIKGPTCATP